LWQKESSKVVSGASGLLGSTGEAVGDFIRKMPRIAGSDDLESAFGGQLWRQLEGNVPRRIKDVSSSLPMVGGADAQQVFRQLSTASNGQQFAQRAAEHFGVPWDRVEAFARALNATPEPSIKGTVPAGLESALANVKQTPAFTEAMTTLRAWRGSDDVDLLESMKLVHRVVMSAPTDWATIVQSAFSAGAGAVGPIATALDLPALTQAAYPPDVAGARSSADNVTYSPNVSAVDLYVLSEAPCNLMVIMLDCLETLWGTEPSRLKFVAEGASFLLSYIGMLWYGGPPLKTYSNGFWSILSFGEDVVLERLKRRPKATVEDSLETVWGFVAGIILIIYLVGLLVDPSIPRPGWLVAKVTNDDKQLSCWVPQTIWCVLTKILCRWFGPIANPKFWTLYFAPAIWMAAYLIGCAIEGYMVYADVKNA
jgi:hypothetical protein